MRVTNVELENIKSYGSPSTCIGLGSGVNAILGENGTGKSTIEEAVGYALFDYTPFKSQDQLVREGESSGVVKVSFISEYDDKEYTVVRYAGRSKYKVIDTGSNESLALGSKAEVIEWLHTHLGVAPGMDLPTLWEASIGVPQTRFLSAFAQTQKPREGTFDPLLDVDYYRNVWGELGDLPKKLAADRDELESKTDRLEGELERFPEVRKEANKLRKKIGTLTDDLATVREELADAEEEFDELDAIATTVTELESKVDRLAAEVESKQEALGIAETELEGAQDAVERLAEVEDDYERHMAAQEEFNDLDEQKSKRDGLRVRQSKLEQEEIRLEREQDSHEEDADTAETAKERMAELKPQVKRYDGLSKKIDSLEADVERIETLGGEIDALQNDITATEEKRNEVTEDIERIEGLQDLAAELEDRRDAVMDLNTRCRQLTAEQSELEEELARLYDLDIDDETIPCPTCNQPLSEEHREEVIEQKEKRLDAIETELDELDECEPDVRAAVTEAQGAQDEVNRLPDLRTRQTEHAEHIEALESDCDDARSEKQDLEARTEALPELRSKYTELDGVTEEYQRAEIRYEDNKDAAVDLEETTEELDAVRADLETVAEDLTEYEGLDEELRTVDNTVEETKKAHNTYLKFEGKAGDLDERQAVVDRLENELDALETDLETTTKELDATADAFDEDRYGELAQRVDDLGTEETELETTIGGKASRLETVESEIEALEAKAEEKAEAEAEALELERDEEFADFIRAKFDDAGPKMREVITNRISQQANTIYQTLRGTAAETLTWDHTYQIVVRVAGTEKPFETLSGGEKMAAALAVRLAILERLSTMGIAFLDEPTANLDSEKRQNLVTQLGALDTFEQLTVISHDDTFETVTEYVTLLQKNESTNSTEVVEANEPLEADD